MVNRSVLLGLLCCLEASAQTQIYQSRDAQGRVVYSDRPPADASTGTAIDIDTAGTNVMPSAGINEQIIDQRMRDEAAARRRTESTQHGATERDRAERELAQAEEALVQAQIVRGSDMIGNAGGGVRPDAAWVQRLEAAQARVEDKTHALERLR